MHTSWEHCTKMLLEHTKMSKRLKCGIHAEKWVNPRQRNGAARMRTRALLPRRRPTCFCGDHSELNAAASIASATPHFIARAVYTRCYHSRASDVVAACLRRRHQEYEACAPHRDRMLSLERHFEGLWTEFRWTRMPRLNGYTFVFQRHWDEMPFGSKEHTSDLCGSKMSLKRERSYS